MADFNISQGDLLPPIQQRLLEPDPVTGQLRPADFTDAQSVVFRASSAKCSGALGGPAVFVGTDRKEGLVEYSWAERDTQAAGELRGCWVVTYNNGKRKTFPNNRYVSVEVFPALPTP